MTNSSTSSGRACGDGMGQRNGSFNDILVARVPSREGEVYDVRGFESDMSAAYMNARVPSNPDNTSEKPSSALQASDVRNTGGHSSGASDRERDREARGGGGSTASTNHVGANERERERGQNGEIDYRKLWEQSQIDNSRLRDELSKTRDELSAAKKKIETVVQTPAPSGGLTDTEKKEKEALVKKLSEMEEELKQFQKLKAENERLKSENRALTRVVSKLTASAAA